MRGAIEGCGGQALGLRAPRGARRMRSADGSRPYLTFTSQDKKWSPYHRHRKWGGDTVGTAFVREQHLADLGEFYGYAL